ncbi:MAG TPA: hypothetical protein VF334_02660 [Polyangia bacterium]
MRTLIPALALVAAACSPGPQGDDESAFTIVRHPPPQATLVINSLEPAQPVEGRVAFAHFTLTNISAPTMTGRVRSTLSPVASAPVAGDFDWPVNGLGAGTSATGEIAFVVPPAAHANFLQLFFQDGATAATAYAVGEPFDSAARYELSLGVHAIDTRAHDADQLWIAWAGHASDGEGWSQLVDGGRFLSGQSSDTTFATSTVDVVPDVGQLELGVILANQGNFTTPVPSLAKAAAALATGDVDKQTIVDGLAPPSWMVTSCDGALAVDRRIYSGRQLVDSAPFPGVFQDVVTYDGFPSPSFCGGTSHYQAFIEIQRRNVDDGAAALTVSPPIGVSRNASIAFSASVGPVDWSVDGGAVNGFIDGNGLYTPPSRSIQNQSIVVRAALRGSPASAIAYVTGAPAGIIVHR